MVKPRPRPRINRGTLKPKPVRDRIRYHKLGEGLPSLPELEMELIEMTDTLMGRNDDQLPDLGIMSLLETADAYFARASEITMLIQQAEREGTVLKGTAYYKFRTGELRTFLDMAKRAADLGSRRLSEEALAFERVKLGRESR